MEVPGHHDKVLTAFMAGPNLPVPDRKVQEGHTCKAFDLRMVFKAVAHDHYLLLQRLELLIICLAICSHPGTLCGRQATGQPQILNVWLCLKNWSAMQGCAQTPCKKGYFSSSSVFLIEDMNITCTSPSRNGTVTSCGIFCASNLPTLFNCGMKDIQSHGYRPICLWQVEVTI